MLLALTFNPLKQKFNIQPNQYSLMKEMVEQGSWPISASQKLKTFRDTDVAKPINRIKLISKPSKRLGISLISEIQYFLFVLFHEEDKLSKENNFQFFCRSAK